MLPLTARRSLLSFGNVGQKCMRILGYILLAFGLVSLLITEMRRYQAPLDMSSALIEKLPDKASYTKQELQEAVRGAALSGAGLARGVATSGVLMMVGGILLDTLGRRRIRVSEAAEPDGAGNSHRAGQ